MPCRNDRAEHYPSYTIFLSDWREAVKKNCCLLIFMLVL